MEEDNKGEDRNERNTKQKKSRAFSRKIQGTKLTPEEGENINKTRKVKKNKKEIVNSSSIHEQSCFPTIENIVIY